MIDIHEIRAFLAASSDPESLGLATQSYTGSPRIHLGIRAGELHSFVAIFVTEHRTELNPDQVIPLLDELYSGDTVAEPILAGMLLAKLPKFRQELPLSVLDGWLDKLVGWVEVDSTCQTAFAPKDLLARWGEWSDFLRRLNRSHNINKRRASLVLLIRTVRESDDPRGIELVRELVDALKSERDRLITKAISWVLREGVRRHAEIVSQFIDANAQELPSQVVREVRTKLATGRKRRD